MFLDELDVRPMPDLAEPAIRSYIVRHVIVSAWRRSVFNGGNRCIILRSSVIDSLLLLLRLTLKTSERMIDRSMHGPTDVQIQRHEKTAGDLRSTISRSPVLLYDKSAVGQSRQS